MFRVAPNSQTGQRCQQVSKLELDSSVEDSAFGVCVDFAEGWVLMRRKNHQAETALACVSDVLRIEEKTDMTERLFGEDSEYRKRSRAKPITQNLIAAVISFEAGLEVPFSLE